VGVAVAAGVAVAFWAGLGLSVSDSAQAVNASERTSTLSVFLSIVKKLLRILFFVRDFEEARSTQLSMENGVSQQNVTDD
jgi:hypothetical protein